ncbi:hypothetical protein ACFFX1_20195 [Dactylosporangium sucinum]|uniref:Integral membrane protein n=1 Tax=Dactylosporangium sucinum TaxID=1424081 RepID=A0A917U2A5_9ACTN|nr:hypothetical protein [Dactylosporangium sucinum]GGM50005.1 hypothetical protein GCM10007977_059610 [Dactylosporangium sucinum]
MTIGPLAALGCAIVAAIGYGLASLLQAIGARRASGTLRILRQPLYAAGVGLDLVAWLMSLVALRTLPVYQVQSVLAGSLAVTVVAVRVCLRVRLRRADVAAIVATIAALVVLAVSAGPMPPIRATTAERAGLLAAAVAVAVLGSVLARAGRASACATAAGLGFGGAALAVQAVNVPSEAWRHPPAAAGRLGTDPAVWALALFAVAGMLLYARALALGDPARATALLWIAEVAAPSAVGVALFGETVRAGWAPAAGLALLVAIGSAAVLATAPAQRALLATSDRPREVTR